VRAGRQRVSRQLGALSACVSALALLAACGGVLEEPPPAPSDAFGTVGPGAAVVPGGNGTTTPGGTIGQATQQLGRTGPRRLSNTEYDNTVHDLLGTKQTLASAFVSEGAAGFDNVASALGMTPSQYESYYNAADTLSPAIRRRTTTAPASTRCSVTSARACFGVRSMQPTRRVCASSTRLRSPPS
jgi:hypothetical protein